MSIHYFNFSKLIVFRKLQYIVFTIIIFSGISAVAQNEAESEAEKHFNAGKYQIALPLFQKLIKKNPANPRLNFMLGFCYFNSPADKAKSIPFFEKAATDPSSDFYYDLKYYLSQAYHLANRFDDAIASFQSMKEAIIPNKSGNELLKDINRRIEMCNYGKTLVQNPRKVNIVNLGKLINSEYQDYAPIISADESFMIFTSRRKGSTGGILDENGDYYEDIYSSKSENNKWESPVKIDSLSDLVSFKKRKWSKAKKLGRAINTDKHDAAIGLSADGQKLFIYRNEDVYISTLTGKNWGVPVKLNSTINTKYKEPSASLSSDEKTLYFVSDRKGGHGGKDIYKSEKMDNGDWGTAQNMGPTINTIYDEEAPFIQSDGKTLYFSSKGHTSMGGFDIFKSVFEEKWSSPENIGYPINTSGDDIYYVVSAKGDHAYFSSLRAEGMGDMDIYLLIFEGVNIPLTEVKGLVLAGDSLKPTGAEMVVTDNETNKEIGTFTVNSETGKYLLIFPPGKNYKLVVTVPGFEPHVENVYIPDQKEYYQLYQEIHFQYVKSPTGQAIGQKVNLQNAFFDINKYARSDSALFSTKDTTEESFSAYLKFVDKEKNESKKIDSLISQDSSAYSKSDKIAFYNPADSVALFNYLIKSQLRDPVAFLPGKEIIFTSKDSLAFLNEIKHPVALNTQKKGVPNTPEDTLAMAQMIREIILNKKVSAVVTPPADKQPDLALNKPGKNTGSKVKAPSSAVVAREKNKEEIAIVNKDQKSGTSKEKDSLAVTSPSTVAKTTRDEKLVATLYFKNNSYGLDSASITELEKMITYFQEDPLLKMTIKGHTDNIGADQYNLGLSGSRAESVKRYFTKKGISYNRIKVHSYGEWRPVAPNDTEEGRKMNRRTELLIY